VRGKEIQLAFTHANQNYHPPHSSSNKYWVREITSISIFSEYRYVAALSAENGSQPPNVGGA